MLVHADLGGALAGVGRGDLDSEPAQHAGELRPLVDRQRPPAQLQ
jgi:hypothetical protein